MSFSGFENADFEIFSIDGLDNRMEALSSQIRPKLNELGNYFAPTLSALAGEEMFAHVAKHARRTINPPKDTWVAFANNKRGYKMLPHFQIGLWQSHVFIWFAIIYEATQKTDFGKKFQSHVNKIHATIPKDFVWSVDHMKPDVINNADLTKDDLANMFVRLQTIKKAEILCGYQIPSAEAVRMSGEEFLTVAENVFKNLMFLYKMP